MLRKYGIKNPQTGLHEKVVGYQFGQKIEVRDPHTGEVDRKPLKPFMVNTSVNVFEKEKIVLNPSDSILVEQIKSYHIVSRSSAGLPVFSSENEHALDAMNLCLLVFEQKYGELMKRIFSTKIIPFETIDHYNGRVQTRSFEESSDSEKTNAVVKVASFGGRDVYVKDYTKASARKRPSAFQRSRL